MIKLYGILTKVPNNTRNEVTGGIWETLTVFNGEGVMVIV
jgi:hypothetical protein